ncbi:hypothetical protein AHF37_05406 [Paragonimus kellicotti]|nr:hypothetical protein AHF37_05406 [Paragonimus kellicotti]
MSTEVSGLAVPEVDEPNDLLGTPPNVLRIHPPKEKNQLKPLKAKSDVACVRIDIRLGVIAATEMLGTKGRLNKIPEIRVESNLALIQSIQSDTQKCKIQREIGTLQLQTTKITVDIKKHAKAGQLDEAKVLARELVNSRKAVSRLRAASAHMDCLVSEMNCQAATAKLAGSLKSSTAIMKSMSELIKVSMCNL